MRFNIIVCFCYVFFLVGCAPMFSPSNRVQKIINAKLYYIPYGVTYFQKEAKVLKKDLMIILADMMKYFG